VNAVVLEGMLEAIGCSHTKASGGREAVALAATQQYAAILMDVQMPDMDGWTATQLIRRAEAGQRHTTIIALTADAAEIHRKKCTEAGMDDFLSKPLTLQALHNALSRWLPSATVESSRAAVPAAASHLSVETLTRITALERRGSGRLFQRVVTIFTETSGRQIDAIEAAAVAGDYPVVRAQCHSLKSAAAHVGADRLARLVMDIERAAEGNDVARVQVLVAALQSAGAAAREALQVEIARRIA
jgi:CheY-like chemotaxis protein